MSEPGLQSQIGAAKAYEALFVPALFGQWVAPVADAAQIETGHQALDVACGTGVQAREIASRVGEGCNPPIANLWSGWRSPAYVTRTDLRTTRATGYTP